MIIDIGESRIGKGRDKAKMTMLTKGGGDVVLVLESLIGESANIMITHCSRLVEQALF